MEELINNHLQRMKDLQSIYKEGTGQHNILGVLLSELNEQLRQYNASGRSEQLKCYCGNTEDVKLIPICAYCYNPHNGEW